MTSKRKNESFNLELIINETDSNNNKPRTKSISNNNFQTLKESKIILNYNTQSMPEEQKNNSFSNQISEYNNNSLISQSRYSLPACNPSQFSFKPKSNNQSNDVSINQTIYQINNTPQKEIHSQNIFAFEKNITAEKLRKALAPKFLDFSEEDNIPHFNTEVKHFPKYPFFKKFSFDDLPELEIISLDDIDKNAFNICKNVKFPSIEEIAPLMKHKNILKEDFDYYSSIAYLLFIGRNNLTSEQRKIVLKNIPIDLINDFFDSINENLSKSMQCPSLSSCSLSSSFVYPNNNITTLCMILTIIILGIKYQTDLNVLKDNFGKKKLYLFINNMCILLNNSSNFRLQRKILSFFLCLFKVDDEILFTFLRKIENIIDENNISSNIVTKMQQILRNRQKEYIEFIIGDKDIAQKIRNNSVEFICKKLKVLVFLLSGTQANYIFCEKDYVELLRFFRNLRLKNFQVDEQLRQLKFCIRKIY